MQRSIYLDLDYWKDQMTKEEAFNSGKQISLAVEIGRNRCQIINYFPVSEIIRKGHMGISLVDRKELEDVQMSVVLELGQATAQDRVWKSTI